MVPRASFSREQFTICRDSLGVLARAVSQPELAVLSAVFHSPHPDGTKIAVTAAQAVRMLPEPVREQYAMLLEDVLPEQVLSDLASRGLRC